jgi:hypothetical protein
MKVKTKVKAGVLLVAGVETPTQECLEVELLDLGLLDYCRTALKRRGRGEDPA